MIFPISLFFALFYIRINAAYHPHLIFKKYIIIRNQKLARILISQSDPVASKTKNAKANRNKLSYAGIVFYGIFTALLFLCAVMWLLPDIPADSLDLAVSTLLITGSTLNRILPSALTSALLFAEFSFHIFNTSKYEVEKTNAKKTIMSVYTVMFLVGVGLTVLCLWSAVYAIMHTV